MMLALTLSLALGAADSQTLRKRGFEALDQIRREYYLSDSRLYCDSIDANGKKSHPSYNWGSGVMLSALNAAARLDSKYKPWLREYADATRVYWNEKGPVPGYDVLPGPKPVDRYYDDNAWMVLALVETHQILGDAKYLNWAEQALTYVLSGWDDTLGGGIWWREAEKKGKNTCSNAPSAAACLAVAKYRNQERLVAKARQILAWTQKNLQDPSDLLFWDNVSLTGRIDKTKWSYNTGLYLRASTMLGRFLDIDGEPLLRVRNAAISRWFDEKTGAIKDVGRFAHLLIEGLWEVSPGDADISARASRALDFVYENTRDSKGRYSPSWEKRVAGNPKKFELIDQASVARAFLYLAGAMKKG